MAGNLPPEWLRRDRWGFFPAAAAVFVLALGVRLLHVWQIHAAPFFSLYLGDARGYHEWGQRLAAGDWLGDSVFYQAPLYPYFLGAFYTFFGDERWLVLSFQAVLGAASCVLLARAGWHFFSPAAGLAAGTILALYAPAVFFDGLLQKSVLDLLFLSLVLWLAGRLTAGPKAPLWGWLGAAIGGLALTRENALVLVAAVLLWIWLSPHPRARRPVTTGLFLLGLALMLLPIAWRNQVVGGEFHLTTSQFGPNFYIGNHENATGVYEPLVPGRGSFLYERQDATELAQQALGRELTPGEVSHYWTRRALDDIAARPGAWLRLLGRKLLLAANAVEVVDTEDQYTYADSSTVLRLLGYVGHFGVIAPLAMLGLFVTWGRGGRLMPLYLMLASYLLSLLAFYVFSRYRYPLIPFLVLLAAAGLTELPRFGRESSRSRLAAVAAAVAAAAIVCNLPLIRKDRMRAITELSIAAELRSQGDLDAAVTHGRRAVELDGTSAMAYYNLGTALQAKGDLDAAIERFRQALKIQPDYARAAVNLGVALASRGETAPAIEQFHRALEIDPRNAETHANLALALLARGESQAAAESFVKALEIDPELASAHLGWGSLLASSGKLDDAILHFRQALRSDPASPQAHYNLGLALQSKNDFRAAIQQYQEAIAADGDFAAGHESLANLLFALAKPEEAIEHYRQVVRIEPENARAHTNLARAAGAVGRFEDAIRSFRAALAVAPDWPPPLVGLAWILATRPEAGFRDPAEAVRLAELAAARTGHRHAGVLDVLAAAYAAAGRFDEAVDTARRALSLALDDNTAPAAEIRERLRRYERREPYRAKG